MWEATDECVQLVSEFLSISEGDRCEVQVSDSQAAQPNPLADFFNLVSPAADVFTNWPWMLAGVGVDTMTVARQSAYFGGRAQFGDGKPVILIPLLGSHIQFLLLSNWLKVFGYRPVTMSPSADLDEKSIANLVHGITKRVGRKAILVAPASGIRIASEIAGAHRSLISDIVVLNASQHPDAPSGVRVHFIASGWSLCLAIAALPQVLRNIQIELIGTPGATVASGASLSSAQGQPV